MVHGIDEGWDAALFVGYHARGGTATATIDHTYTSRVHEARLNNRPVGELGLNAALAGTFGVPVALVSGDDATAAEARAWLGDGPVAVVVKQGVSRFAARSVAPAVARERIREGVVEALGRRHRPLIVDRPSTIEVELQYTHMADMAELVPGAIRRGPRTVAYTHDDFRELFRAWRAFYTLAGAV